MVIVGEHLVDHTTTKTTKVEITRHTGRIAEVVLQDRAYSYKVGDLGAARTAFTEATKLTVDWGEDGDEDQDGGDTPHDPDRWSGITQTGGLGRHKKPQRFQCPVWVVWVGWVISRELLRERRERAQ